MYYYDESDNITFAAQSAAQDVLRDKMNGIKEEIKKEIEVDKAYCFLIEELKIINKIQCAQDRFIMGNSNKVEYEKSIKIITKERIELYKMFSSDKKQCYSSTKDNMKKYIKHNLQFLE